VARPPFDPVDLTGATLNTDDTAANAVSQAPGMGGWKTRFFAIWTGQAVSLIGSVLTQFVLIWYITRETGSAAALATAGIAGLLPNAIFSPLGGALADRHSRRAIMIVADALTALCMAVLVWLFATQRVELCHVYTLMAVRSALQAFQRPAAAASTVNLVPPEFVQRAAGMNQALEGVLAIAGAPLGALALAWLPFQAALGIDVVTAILGILPLFVYAIPQPKSAGYEQPESMLGSIVEGARYIFSNRALLILYGLVGLVVLTVMPTFTLTPLLVTDYFGGGVNQVAVMEGVAGVAMIVGGLAIGLWPPRRHRVGVALVSWSLSCAAVALTALAPSTLFPLAVFWWAVSGFTYATGNAPFTAVLQTVVPNELQGRAFSLLNMVFGFAGPIGLIIAGPLGEALGVRAVFIVGGFSSAAICAAGLLSASLRQIEDVSAAVDALPEPEATAAAVAAAEGRAAKV
jgi:DHA3 family macrolide efflux protein-like MFS transporter